MSKPDTTPDSRKTAPSSTSSETDHASGPGRYPAIRVILPDKNNPSNQSSGVLPLEGLIDQVTQTKTQIDYLELLMTPGESQYEHYLVPHNTSKSSAEAIRKALAESDQAQAELEEFSDPDNTRRDDEIDYGKIVNSDDDSTKTTLGTVTNALEEHCPVVDYQIGNLDLSPLADTPVPTSRLLVHENQRLESLEGTSKRGSLGILLELLDKNIPHIYQLLIERAHSNAKHDFHVTVRLAVFDEEYGIITDDDLTSHLGGSYQYAISNYFRDEVCTDNFNLNIQRVTELLNDDSSSRYQLNGRPTYLQDQPYPLAELATFREYNNLLAGTFNTDSRYEQHFKCYGRMPASGNSLTSVANIHERYPEHPAWDRTAVSDGVSFSTSFIPSTAETPQRLGEQTPTNVTSQERDQSTSEAHYALSNNIITYAISQGYTILAVDQETIDADLDEPDPTTQSYFPGDSQPDIVAEKDGSIVIFEAEINDSNPAAFLKNLERAQHFGHDVIVVTQESKLLEHKLTVASRPFSDDEETAHGVRLYNLSEHAVETDDVTYLLPRGVTETRWYLSTDDELTLVADGEVIATGHAEDPLETFSYKGPHCRTEDSEYVVRSASGEYITADTSKKTAIEGFTTIKRPFIPTAITYLDNLELRYRHSDTNHLKRYYEEPIWAQRHANKPGKRHKAGRTEFIKTHTTEDEGSTLFIPNVRELSYPWFDHQTRLDPPDKNWFARDIGHDFDASDTGSRDRELLDRTWYYSPGLDPEFPDFPDP